MNNNRLDKIIDENINKILKEDLERDKREQMNNDWSKWEEDFRNIHKTRPYDFRDFNKHQEIKDSLDYLNGETSRKAYLNGKNDEDMKKIQDRYNRYKKHYGIITKE